MLEFIVFEFTDMSMALTHQHSTFYGKVLPIMVLEIKTRFILLDVVQSLNVVLFMKSAFCPTATDKVALLMGNMNYLHHRQLRAPMADVHELTNLLRQLDFKVVSLLDLNWQEMNSAVTEFLLLLDRGVYGEFFSLMLKVL